MNQKYLQNLHGEYSCGPPSEQPYSPLRQDLPCALVITCAESAEPYTVTDTLYAKTPDGSGQAPGEDGKTLG